jgi:hypothetical protein
MGLDRLYLFFDDPHVSQVRTLSLNSTRITCSLIAETELIYVATCCGFKLTKSCINLERTGYHVVDAAFWVVLELVIRWIRFQSNLIDLSCMLLAFHI